MMRSKSLLLFAAFYTITYSIAAQCDTYRFNTSSNAKWMSCQKSTNPNPARGNSHWILYDLGTYHTLSESWLWNINDPDHIQYGVEAIAIDYSLDKADWSTLGNFSVAQATGSSLYAGTQGPNFNNVQARYVLITLLSGYTGSICIGFGEIAIETAQPLSEVTDILENVDVTIYPNPASQVVTLDLSEVKEPIQHLSIATLSGQMKAILQPSSNILVDVAAWSEGLYILNVQTQNGQIVKKFSVIRE